MRKGIKKVLNEIKSLSNDIEMLNDKMEQLAIIKKNFVQVDMKIFEEAYQLLLKERGVK